MAGSDHTPRRAPQGATQRNNKKTWPRPVDLYSFDDNCLSHKQRTAVELLLRGLSDIEAAAQLGVDRGTVYRWRTRDEEFIAEMERQRQVLYQQSAQRLQAMFEPALDILHKQLTSGDPRLALRAAALLLRIATPARLAKIAGASASSPAAPPASLAQDVFDKLLDGYINAPLPGRIGREIEASANSVPDLDPGDDDDKNLDDLKDDG